MLTRSWVSAFVAVGCSSGGADAGPDPTTTSESSSGDGASSDAPAPDDSTSTTSGTVGTPGDSSSGDPSGGPPPAGEWCGNASAGRIDLGPARAVPFGRHNGAPTVFAAAQVGEGDNLVDLRVAIFDRERTAWGEPVIVHSGGAATRGAVDGVGNAMVYVSDEEASAMHRYDAGSEQWSETALPALHAHSTEEFLMSPSGHGVLLVQVLGGSSSFRALFYDPATSTWSDPLGPPEAIGGGARVGQDLETGDVVLVSAAVTGGGVVAWFHDAETGEVTSHTLTAIDVPSGVAWMGDGEFMIAGSAWDGRSNLSHAVVFDGASFGSPEFMGAPEETGLQVTASSDGRAAVHWVDTRGGSFVRLYERGSGWREVVTASPTIPNAMQWWTPRGSAVAFDSSGMFFAWSVRGSGEYVRTHAVRSDGTSLDGQWTLEPSAEFGSTGLRSLVSLGDQQARAVWGRRVGEFGTDGFAYACHTPEEGWSAPVGVDAGVLGTTPVADGGVLIFAYEDETDTSYFEYFAPS